MRHLLFGCILLTSIAVASAALAGDLAKARQELASTGKLRVGVVSAPKADAFFVVKNADDRPRGVTVDLGDELARTLNVSSEFFVAHNSGEITDALEKGLIDVAFMPVDDERRKRVEFGPAYILFESTCLVLGSSDFRAISDLDRAGVRVAGETNTTTIRSVARVLKLATIVAVPSVGEAIDMLRNGKVDAFALGAMHSRHIRQRFRVRVFSMVIFTGLESRSQCQRTDRTRSPRRRPSSKKRRHQA